MPQFIGERIEVETGGVVKQPVSLTWRDHEYRVTEILASWFDWGFSSAVTQRDWRTRRHRNCFRLKVDSGELFEIYLDRAPARTEGEWYLYQVLDEV